MICSRLFHRVFITSWKSGADSGATQISGVRTVSMSTRRGLVAKGMIVVQESADVE